MPPPIFIPKPGFQLRGGAGRPVWPFVLNKDSPQANGLVAWYPLGYVAGDEPNLAAPGLYTAANSATTAVSGAEMLVARNFIAAQQPSLNTVGTPVAGVPLTLCGWFNVTAVGSNRTVVSVSDGSIQNYVSLRAASTALVAARSTSGGVGVAASSADIFAANVWNHGVVVFAAATSRAAYLNGGGKGTSASANTPVGLNQINIGSEGGANFFGGQLTDIRVYNRALSDQEVWDLYDGKTRWDLYYPISQRVYSLPLPAPANPRTRQHFISKTRRQAVPGNVRPPWPYELNTDSPQADGLVLWAPLGIGAGDEPDVSPNRRILSNTDTFIGGSNDSNFGPVRRFNNSGTLGLASGVVPKAAPPLTLMAWFNPVAANVGYSLVALSRDVTATDNYRLVLTSAGLVNASVSLAGVQQVASATATYTAGQWQHAAAVIGSTTYRAAYLNGTNKGTNATASAFGVVNRFNVSGFFQGSTTLAAPMDGLLCDVRVYNRMLSDEEIYCIYDAESRWDLYYPIGKKLWFLPIRGPQTYGVQVQETLGPTNDPGNNLALSFNTAYGRSVADNAGANCNPDAPARGITLYVPNTNTIRKNSRPDYGRSFGFNRDSPQANGLLAWYPMGFDYREVFERSANESMYTLSGIPSPSFVDRVRPAPGDAGPGLYFEGNGSDLLLGTGSAPRPVRVPFTLAAWFHPLLLTSGGGILHVGEQNPQAGGDGWELRIGTTAGSEVVIARSGLSAQAISTAPFRAGALQHACGVFAHSTSRAAYLDGANKGTNTTFDVPNIPGPMYITVGINNNNSAFGPGWLFDLRVYNRALSDEEIWDLYDPKTRWDLYKAPPTPAFFSFETPGPVSVSKQAGRLTADNLGATDVASDRLVLRLRQLTESLAIDSVTDRQATYARALADNAGLNDAVADYVQFLRQVVINLGVTDAITALLAVASLSVTVAENLGATDSTQRLANAFRIAADNLGMTDTNQRLANAIRLVADNMAGTDSTARLANALRQFSENTGIADVTQRVANGLRQIADNVGTTDSQQRIASALRQLSDGLGAVDATARLANAFRQFSENFGFSDTAKTTLLFLRTLTDNLGTTDSTARVANAFRIITNNLGQTDSVRRIASAFRVVADNLGATDTTARLANAFRLVSDNFATTDSQQRLASAFRVASENLGTTDTTTRLANAFRLVSNNLGTTDSQQRLANAFRVVADNLGANDTVRRLVNTFRLVTDNLGTVDSTQRLANALRVVADNLGAADSQQRVASAFRTVADNLGTTDAAGRLVSTFRLVSDNFGTTDTTDRLANAFRTLADNFGLADQVASATARLIFVIENLGAADAVVRQALTSRLASENLGAADDVQRRANAARVLSDTMAGVDAADRAVAAARAVSELLGAADTTARQVNTFRLLSELLGGQDATSRLVQTLRQVSDNFGAADTTDRHANALRILSESLGIRDTADRQVTAFRQIADSLAFTDLIQLTTALTIHVIDALGAADSADRRADALRTLNEMLGGQDSVRRLATHFRALAESCGFADVFSYSATWARKVSDLLGFDDDVTALLAAGPILLVVLEHMGAHDTSSSASVFLRTIADLLALRDTAQRSLMVSRQVADPLGELDALARSAQAFRALDEHLGGHDQADRLANAKRSLQDLLGEHDATTRHADAFRAITELLGEHDTSNRSASYFRTLSDMLGVHDLALYDLLLLGILGDVFHDLIAPDINDDLFEA